MVATRTRRLLAAAAFGLASAVASAATGLTTLAAPPESGPITVFYPTAAPAARLQRGPFVVEAALDAAPQRGNGRLVVMSHGSGGSPWPQADLANAAITGFFVQNLAP